MIYILIPIYNEEDNIENLANNLHNLNLAQEIYFVFSDDGSKDNSIALLNKYFKNDKFHVISDGINYGPGHAFNIGIQLILKHSTSANDIVITLESDNTGDYSLIPIMVANNNLGYDLILASVYAQGGGFQKTSFFRKLISFLANMFFRAVFDIKVLTLSSFYRCYDINLLKRLESKYSEHIIEETGFICMLEILLKAIKVDAKVLELPMQLKSDNRNGKSKMKIFKTSMLYLKFLFKYKFS